MSHSIAIFERFLKIFVGLMRTDVYMLLEVLIILPVIVKVTTTTRKNILFVAGIAFSDIATDEQSSSVLNLHYCYCWIIIDLFHNYCLLSSLKTNHFTIYNE